MPRGLGGDPNTGWLLVENMLEQDAGLSQGLRIWAADATSDLANIGSMQDIHPLLHRRTIRQFDPLRLVSDEIMISLAERISAFDSALASHSSSLSDIDIRICRATACGYKWYRARRSDGLASFSPGRTVRPGDLVPDLSEGAPPLLVSIGANLERAVSQNGLGGYRSSLLSAGMLAFVGWAAALERGLAGGIFASVDHRYARALTERNMTRRHLLSLAVGYELSAGEHR